MYSLFCLKLRCHGNKGYAGVNLNDTVKLADPENRTRIKNYDSVLYTTGVMTF